MTQSAERVVRVGELVVEKGEVVLTAYGLGSCVAIMLSDVEAQVGGMAHILLPSPTLARRDANPGRFPQTAVPKLMGELLEQGAALKRVTARLVGGASMFSQLSPPGAMQIGERNVLAAKSALREAGVLVVGEATGGAKGRTVRFNAGTGVVTIRTVGEDDVTL